ncbi:hypothetical protein BSL78_05221 [Apostichopus japonicus]|uniref:Amidohydrolase-related domain-containing protein n=1 Tax=Stichopus japonicus TaxID=307972 RepID=A0A2G8LC34_STIJA|nr:hypothetical protein BSL78_05221 [Apostichopus japonicus]
MNSLFSAPVVDTHVHFWDLKKFQYQWPTSEIKELYRNFLPDDYLDAVKEVPDIKNAIFVQVHNGTIKENDWVLEFVKSHKWIVGMVGWVDLTDPDVEDILVHYAQSDRFLGVRHITELEPSDWLGREDVHRGLKLLEKHGLTFDILLRPHMMDFVPQLAPKFPKLSFIIDHLAKPKIKEKEIEEWKTKMTLAASYQNVYCKLSGMVTEADWENWSIDDLKPYVQHCVKVFGAARCMYGSDYPVFSRTTAKYKDVFNALVKCLEDCTSAEEREDIFCNNAVRIYKIKAELNKESLA